MREVNFDIVTPLEIDLDDYSGSDLPVCLRIETELVHAAERLDVALAALVPEHSRSRLQSWIRQGRVRLDGQTITDTKKRLRGGECIELDVGELESATASLPENIPLDVVYEDAALIVLNKPAGLVVHPGSGNWSGTLLNALLAHHAEAATLPRAGIVHRLDKETSGLMVVAKTLAAQTDLVRQLQARTVKRHYHAFALIGVGGKPMPERGLVDAPIGRHPTQRTKMAVIQGGREARTHYRVIERMPQATWIECVLDTGRTHQIRVHMAHLGYPLVGDPVYAGRRSMPAVAAGFARQALHAFRLGLIHPLTGQAMQWEAPMPQDMQDLLAGLRQ
ncbi:23S rRNA pseudouridine(1911/1915/1917) synthase RluD [Uliginosibacterium gangwonense]|uniref:23S rRNA pseudouridine(1911/1915/1917) synthase RluD n=1 Tax=Uliginosibacterium gangwonense TaxID=392736 RepID=UPI0003616F88